MSSLKKERGMRERQMKNRDERRMKSAGFTLIEVVVGMGLIAVAVLGLAQMFTLAVMNNLRSDRITTASFLAQQQVEVLRNLTQAELSSLAGSSGVDLNGDGTNDINKDEFINLNSDNIIDYRRITEIQATGTSGSTWQVRVLVVASEEFNTPQANLLQNPQNYRVRALVNTMINR
jgi:prepilin-type N-terminal cleavage/methylation domain-containing protein